MFLCGVFAPFWHENSTAGQTNDSFDPGNLDPELHRLKSLSQGKGRLKALTRKTAIWSRVTTPSGQKLYAPQPLVMP